MKKRNLYLTIIIASIIGLLIASYLTYNHYGNQIILCDVNGKNSCHDVLNGPYSELFFNIPNSLIGALGFLLFGSLGYLGLKDYKVKEINRLLLIFSSISLIFILYLAYLIFFVIYSFCIYCFTTWILVIIIFICSILLNKK